LTEWKSNFTSLNLLRGWILDLYPSAYGEMTVWLITEKGERVKLIDEFRPKIYVSGNIADLSKLAEKLSHSKSVVKWTYVEKYADFMSDKKSKVLEVTVIDCRVRLLLARRILRLGGYDRYRLYNADVPDVQMYLYEKDIFPLAHVGVAFQGKRLAYWLMDSVESIDYKLPPLRQLTLEVQIANKKPIPSLKDAIQSITLESECNQTVINEGDEKQKILSMVEALWKENPDIILTDGGDSFLFPYLIHRASVNNLLGRLVLGRENVPLKAERKHGTTFFSYGRVYFKAPTQRLHGRIHIDTRNTFIHSSSGLQGLIEVARTCRVPLHRAARASIGTIMSSLQLYQAIKDDILVPWKKSEPESYKSGWELLIADRGGFIFEPKLGLHDNVVEVDFASMFPTLMATRNISGETVLCRCCPNSTLRVPELGYNVCRKREGIVPKTLWLILKKRALYKQLRDNAENAESKGIFDLRQGALKWILVTCFGYLGYRNSRFGKVDAHIAVCAFARDALLKTVRIAEERGFEVIHGIVDSLWLKKENAEPKDYAELCGAVSRETGLSLNVEGVYRWIVFLPSKTHAGVPVLNRYYGVFDSGKIKVRGIEARRSDTPKFINDAQMDMIQALAKAHNSQEFIERIPEALKILKNYAKRLIEGRVPATELLIAKRLSKHPSSYTHGVLNSIAAKQLIREGVEISAGQTIQYLITRYKGKSTLGRVQPAQLLGKNIRYDSQKYLELLFSSAANILDPFGCSANYLHSSLFQKENWNPERLASPPKISFF
jgi:DNA polymerase elongation subunit (family B)